MFDLTRLDVSAVALAGVLVAMVATSMVAGVVSSEQRRRRDAASLTAIDFVRSSFAGRLARGEPMAELLLRAVEALRDSFELETAEVWLNAGGVLRIAAADPPQDLERVALDPSEESIAANARVSGRPWIEVWIPALLQNHPDSAMRVAPISASGSLLGLILVARRHRGDRLPDEADATLAELARELGISINKQRLDAALRDSLDELRRQAADLQASRARIVAVADAERRRIERDLHDGAQQYLVAIAVKARLLQELAEADPAMSRTLLEGLASDVELAHEELRTLAHGIYPPLLSDSGLGLALSAAARRASIPVELHTSGLGRYPPEIEAAIYFCCLEALQNAAKYAGEGAAVTLRICQEARDLRFEVRDDGAGFDLCQRGTGAGVTNMTDRLGAVGGRLSIESEPGRGTRVLGTLPLPPPVDDATQVMIAP